MNFFYTFASLNPKLITLKFKIMAYIRFEAIKEVFNRQPLVVEAPSGKVSDYYGCNVFDYEKMRKYLSMDAYNKVMEAIEKGTRIDRKVADQIASGMKAWSMENGVTHYTHWFHPLTDGTAEKHDAFIEHAPYGGIVENFSGKLLAQQEPDASSFPSGGLRNTFEARGYTAWDPSSPAFIIGNTLSIPTIFVSYTGDALDHKTPLIKALAAIDKAATEVCQYFDKNVTKVISNLGWEQEYFLVDSALYEARPDLALTGRTLVGHASAKDQQLEDHYFSSIPWRVIAFMQEFEIEAYKLGIPIKTRHNEVAPNQFECAPVYEECNLAVDHNLLMMDLAKKIAKKHHFVVLFHEKPFSGINGSGKHNNWSLSTDTGVNLLSPGKNPKSNLQFLTFLVNTITAVYKNADLLRASISSAGNMHRLGANEAPPAIISVFLGKQLSAMLDEIETKVSTKKMTPDEKTALKPTIVLDAGIATEDNIKWLRNKHYHYIVVSRKKKKAIPAGVAMISVKEDKQGSVLVQAGLCENKETNELELYCYSLDKEKKEEGIQNKFQQRFEAELLKARNALELKYGTKQYDKVLERIGRAKERFKLVSHQYKVTVEHDDKMGKAVNITWSRKKAEHTSGVYCLRTDRKDLDEKQIWDIYTMLTDVEDAFRCMKSELGLRPIYHQKETRCDGHLFITTIAYHLLHTIRFKLRQKGVRFCWTTIRKQLSTQVRITTTMKRKDNKVVHIRKSSKAEPAHQVIYDALNLAYQPGRIVKTVL